MRVAADSPTVLAYNVPVGRHAGWRCSWSTGIQHTWRKACEGGSGQPGGDGAVALDFGVLAYNIPGGRLVRVAAASPAVTAL